MHLPACYSSKQIKNSQEKALDQSHSEFWAEILGKDCKTKVNHKSTKTDVQECTIIGISVTLKNAVMYVTK